MICVPKRAREAPIRNLTLNLSRGGAIGDRFDGDGPLPRVVGHDQSPPPQFVSLDRKIARRLPGCVLVMA